VKTKLLGISIILVSMSLSGLGNVVASCPRSEQAGVWVAACNIGEDVQILYHNDNDYRVSFSAKVTYTNREGTQVRWIEGRGRPGTGGQITIFNVPGLRDVVDIELRNLVKDD
jgi:hypothetical protein